MTQPSDRDQIIAKVREAIDDDLNAQGLMVFDGDLDTEQLAEAAFDALVEAWGPPW